MKIMLSGGSAEITEKKSRFIADARPVRSQQEADEFISSIKKKYWDARHHCSAEVTGDRGEFMHSSDDGEPSGTAGKPILSVLTGSGVTDACIVVTRYFGGTLLGTGGLVRAYSLAAKSALEASLICEVTDGFRIRFLADYKDYGIMQRLLEQLDLPVSDTAFTDKVEVETVAPPDRAEHLKKAAADQTAGRVRVIAEQKARYVIKDSVPVILT